MDENAWTQSIVGKEITNLSFPNDVKILLPLFPEYSDDDNPTAYIDPTTYGAIVGIANGKFESVNINHETGEVRKDICYGPFACEIASEGEYEHEKYMIVPAIRCKKCGNKMVAKVYADNKKQARYQCIICRDESLSVNLDLLANWGGTSYDTL